MTFPLWIFLAVYGVFFLIASFFLFFNFYHIARFGLQGLKTTLVLMLYTVSFLALVFGQVYLLLSIDWTQDIHLNEAFFSSTPAL